MVVVHEFKGDLVWSGTLVLRLLSFSTNGDKLRVDCDRNPGRYSSTVAPTLHWEKGGWAPMRGPGMARSSQSSLLSDSLLPLRYSMKFLKWRLKEAFRSCQTGSWGTSFARWPPTGGRGDDGIRVQFAPLSAYSITLLRELGLSGFICSERK